MTDRLQWIDLLCEEKKVNQSREIKTENDARSIFDKDYHRIVSSSSFRRLQDKAQVFPLEKFDFVRTRLTHSIEVASLAKSLGRDIVPFLEAKEKNKNFKHIPTILECSGLIHDIGNPPFGHFGETSIRDWFIGNAENIVCKDNKWFLLNPSIAYGEIKTQRKLVDILNKQQLNDFCFFEGNAQSLRNAMKLNYLIDENGLNLSFPLLNTIIKYPINSLEINSEEILLKKNGFFYSENNEVIEIMNCTKTKINGKFCRHPLTFLLEAADDITYLTDDLEDAFNKKKLRVSDIEKILQENYCHDDFCNEVRKKIESYRKESIKQEYKNEDMYIIQRLKIFIQGQLISFVVESFKNNYDQIMEGTFTKTLLSSSIGSSIETVLINLATRFVFNSKEILENEIKGHKIIEEILNELIIGILNLDDISKSKSYFQKLYFLISDNYRLIYEKKIKSLNDLQQENNDLFLSEMVFYKILLITDFICGMTDTYAYDFYQKIQSIE